MIFSMLWKEWREQRAIGVAIIAFGAGAIALTAQVADPSNASTSGRLFGLEGAGSRELIAVALAYLAGSVCGAMLIADEKEAGTVEFLHSLPSTRRKLWIAKTIFGMSFTIVQCVILTLLADALGCLGEHASVWKYGSFVVMIGLLAFSWGMFGGTIARSTLGAVFLGALGAMLSSIVLAIPFAILVRLLLDNSGLVALTFYVAWVLVGLVSTATVFTRIDRARLTARPGRRTSTSREHRGWNNGILALLWLALRQSIRIGAVACVLGLFVGAVMVTPAAQPVLVWPVATMSLGVLAGTTALGEEQTRGIARFWAERRLPLGRLWLIKVGFHFAIATVAALLMFLPLFAAVPMSPFRTALLSREALRPELFRFLWLGLVYGFAVGHLCGMLFRKTIVAGLASIVMASTFAVFIVPSIVCGGASAWQVWAPALVLLLTARLLVYPWATERVAARGPMRRAVGGVSLALALLALSSLFRIYEIPEVSDRLAESGFEQSIPPYEQNDGGRQTRSAAAQFRRAAQEAQPLLPAVQPGPGGRPRNVSSETNDSLDRVARRSWDESSQDMKPWLDRVFAADWLAILDDIQEKPLGVFEDPRDTDFFTPTATMRDLREMQLALRARINQRIAEGHAEECPRLLRDGLLAARTSNNKCGIAYALQSLESEDLLLAGLAHWLDSTAGEPAVLRRLLLDLQKHDREMPISTEDQDHAEETKLRNTMDRVSGWATLILEASRAGGSSSSTQIEAEAELVAMSWSVPWERRRRERILQYQSHSDLRVSESWLSGLHLKHLWRPNRASRLEAQELQGLTARRFAILQVALRLYEVECGVPAQSLDQLVPRYLPGLPTDPYSGRAFHYRLSSGEILNPGALDEHAPVLAELYIGAGVAASLSHPIGGWNGAWVVSGLISLSSPGAGGASSFLPVGATSGIAQPSMVRASQSRIVPRGTGVIWSVGLDGIDDGGRRTFVSANSVGRGVDLIVLVPSIQGLPETKRRSPRE